MTVLEIMAYLLWSIVVAIAIVALSKNLLLRDWALSIFAQFFNKKGSKSAQREEGFNYSEDLWVVLGSCDTTRADLFLSNLSGYQIRDPFPEYGHIEQLRKFLPQRIQAMKPGDKPIKVRIEVLN